MQVGLFGEKVQCIRIIASKHIIRARLCVDYCVHVQDT